MRIGGRSSGPVPVSETRPKGMIRFAGAQKPPPPLAAQLQRMGSLKSLAERQNLYQTLRAQHPLPYRAAEKAALEQTLLQIRGLAQQAAQTPGGLSRLMQQLHKRGYLLLFKDDVLRPGKDTRALLEAFEYDTQDIREYERAYRRDGEALTVGELLPEFFNADACFVPGDQAENARSSPQRGTFKSPRQGYLLFSDSFDQLRPNLFWHELFHALQHENGLYQAPHYQEPTGFCKREMEASQFVIDHATLLKANVRDHMGELRVWSLRFAEYLQARKPQQTLLA